MHWAHRVRDRFPDGQLYVDLRGYSTAAPMRPIEALAQFVQALSPQPVQLPDDPAAAAGVYRSLLAGKRVLVVLDNAANSEQVRLLLPGSPGCLALVTSRDRLGGLVVRDGARPLPLSVLSAEEAHRLLAGVLGADRAAADPEGAAALADACGHLPLALRVAAAALLDQPEESLAGYAHALRRGGRMAVLAVPGEEQAGVRHSFDLSYQALPAAERRLLRLLGVAPVVDFTSDSAAALAAVPLEQAATLLARLVAAHLVNRSTPGRYTLHDLIREYAAGHVYQESEQQAAVDRLTDWYLHGADAATRRLHPQMQRLPVPAPATPVAVPFADTDAAALAWLDAEQPNLVALVRHAAAHGGGPATWLLAETLRAYFWMRMPDHREWVEIAQLALTAAQAAGDQHAQAATLLGLGDAEDRRCDWQQASRYYTQALQLAEATGWTSGQITALTKLGTCHRALGRPADTVVYVRQAQQLCSAQGTDAGYLEAALSGTLGHAYQALGRLAEAAEQVSQALAGFRRSGAAQGEYTSLVFLGEIQRIQGRYLEAEAHLNQALPLARAAGDQITEAYALRDLAAVHRDSGRVERAMELAQAAAALADESSDSATQADVLNVLGSIQLQHGDPTAAAVTHQRALDLARAAKFRYSEVAALIGLAWAHARLERPEPAREHAELAVRHSQEAGYALLEREARTVTQVGSPAKPMGWSF